MKDNTRGWLLHTASVLVGAAILLYIAGKTGFQQFLQDMRTLDPVVFIPLVTVYSVSWLLRGLRFKSILSLLGCKTGIFKAMGVELIADLPNQIIPARLGDSVKILYLHNTKMLNYTSAALAAFLVRAMDLVAVVILTLISVVFVSDAVSSAYHSYLVPISLVVCLLLLSWWVFVYHTEVFSAMLFGPLKKIRENLFSMAAQMRDKPGQLAMILFESMMIWIFDVLTLFILLLFFGVELTFAEAAFVVMLSTVAKTLPLTPNGLGVYEGMMVLILKGFSTPESTAFTIAVLDHGFMNLYSAVLSLGALYAMGLGTAEIRKLMFRNRGNNQGSGNKT